TVDRGGAGIAARHLHPVRLQRHFSRERPPDERRHDRRCSGREVSTGGNARSTRVGDTRRRAHHMVIAEANDALATLNVPSNWKSAIHSALPSGVTVL